MYSGVALTAAKTVEREQAERERERGTEKITTGREREMRTSGGVSLAAVSTPHATKHPLPLPLKRTKE